MEHTYTLFDLQEHLRRVVALNFSAAVWLTCELAQCSLSKGQYYLSLVQKATDSDQVLAQADGILWQRTYKRLKQRIGSNILNDLLQTGRSVRLQVRLDFHERYGLKYFIEDVNAVHTIGQLELMRQATIGQLRTKNLLQKNARLPLPIVLQRIAVLSSEHAAGLQDFLAQLEQNPYHYRFKIVLFSSSMQGSQVQEELVKQLYNINHRADDFDLIVVVRGGGARLDLRAFDDVKICEAVANSQLPVLTGIGHDVDEVVLDKVAHTALKTPTAAADFVIQHNADFETSVLILERQFQAHIKHFLAQEQQKLRQQSANLRFIVESLITQKQTNLNTF
ncbi:MAG: exodeoxyribonuclease VII large subunit, partial [Bacteroidota bacterium]